MAVKTSVSVTHGNEQYATIVNKLLYDASLPKREMVALRNFFHAAAGEDRAAKVVVQIDSGDAVYASQTLTVSSGAIGDTAVINGTTLTAVDHRDTTNITYAADSSGSKNSKYWLFQDQSGLYKYYVWFNINAAGVDPQIAGRVGIKVSGATNATAATLGAATVTACAGTDYAKITFAADSAGSLNNTYFTFRSLDGQNKGYFWFNINSLGVDPAPSGFPSGSGIQVAGATNAAAATLATAAYTAAIAKGAIKGFYVTNSASTVISIYSSSDDIAPIIKDSVLTPTNFVVVQAVHGVTLSNGSSGHVVVTNNDAGSATAAADGAATSTGFTFTHSITGSAVTSSQYNIGFTDTLTAASLAAAINTKMVWVATATSAAAVVTVSSFFPGPAGNAITLTASAGNSAGGATLASGALPTSVSTLTTYHSGV